MIPGLPQVGGMELIILLTIVLLFFGAKRIPDLARSLGKGTREFREGIRGATAEENDKDEVRDRGEEKDEEQRASLDGADRDETARAAEETGATRSGQKA
jgi:sec-independent protein translocase protein TatA